MYNLVSETVKEAHVRARGYSKIQEVLFVNGVGHTGWLDWFSDEAITLDEAYDICKVKDRKKASSE